MLFSSGREAEWARAAGAEKMARSSKQLCSAVVWAATALAGCVATATQAPTRGFTVTSPPPPPIQEARTRSPSPTATWVGGYWHWTGAEYAWIPGHWETAPAGASWYAPRYVQTEGGYLYEPGGWKGGVERESRGNALR